MSEMKEKLHTGELYLPGDAEIIKEQAVYQDKPCDYNQTRPSEGKKRMEMLPDIRFYRSFVSRHINTICRFTLEEIAGLEPEAWSQKISLQMW